MNWAEIAPPRRVVWTERERPVPASPTDVVVRLAFSGLCGTDVRRWIGRGMLPGQWLNQGHEMAGIVEAVGTHVVTCKVGDRVCIQWYPYVGGGAWADHLLIDERGVYILPAGVPLDVGVLAEPMATCVHAIDIAVDAGIRSGSTALIGGAGTAGLLMLALSKVSGFSRVFVSEPMPERREIALRLGADAVYDPTATDVAADVAVRTGGDGVDAYFDCVSSPESYQTGLAALRRGGVMIAYGVADPGTPFELSPAELHHHGHKLIGSTGWEYAFPRAVAWLGALHKSLRPLLSDVLPLEELQAGLKMTERLEGIKVLLRHSGEL
jgi:L-iditol 2-dehydrogenase